MFEKPKDVLRKIADLRNLAKWYRAWATLAGNCDERQSRLGIAETIETKIDELFPRC